LLEETLLFLFLLLNGFKKIDENDVRVWFDTVQYIHETSQKCFIRGGGGRGGGRVAYSNLETFRVGSKTSTDGLVDIPFCLILKMTTAKVFETSDTVKNGPI